MLIKLRAAAVRLDDGFGAAVMQIQNRDVGFGLVHRAIAVAVERGGDGKAVR